jgi:hypothetical protein
MIEVVRDWCNSDLFGKIFTWHSFRGDCQRNYFDCKQTSLQCTSLQRTIKQTFDLRPSVDQFIQINSKFLVVLWIDIHVLLDDISRSITKMQVTTVSPSITRISDSIQSHFMNFHDIAVSSRCSDISSTIDRDENRQSKPSPDIWLFHKSSQCWICFVAIANKTHYCVSKLFHFDLLMSP